MQLIYPPVLLLMGVTASGKSALAVKLAQILNGEIISVDSALVFKEMNIGTAKPTLEERGGVTHHLIDILEPCESFSTGQFRDMTLQLLEAIIARGKLPILVGGTMLYFNALTHGLATLPPANFEIRQRLDEELVLYGKQKLYDRLKKIDPESALRIHPNDPQRVQRALEVYEMTGKSLTTFFLEQEIQSLPYRFIKIIISPSDRKKLHTRIAFRFHEMLKNGFLDELDALYQRGDLNETMPSIRAVGYREGWSYLNGEYDLDTMTEKAIIATRQLAKRQFTWLRRETQAKQFETDDLQLLSKILHYLNSLS